MKRMRGGKRGKDLQFVSCHRHNEQLNDSPKSHERKKENRKKVGRKKEKEVGIEIVERKGRKWERIKMGMRHFLQI